MFVVRFYPSDKVLKFDEFADMECYCHKLACRLIYKKSLSSAGSRYYFAVPFEYPIFKELYQ